MRLASFNVENLFDRARAMNLKNAAEGKPILERFAELGGLLAQPSYSAADKSRMAKLLKELGLERSDTSEFVILRRNRGALLRWPRSGGVEIVADGRADWVGSLELVAEPIDEQAMRNTARVMRDIEADVLGVVEVERRPVLRDFNNDVISALGGEAYRHAMVIDGNDMRGIDVGLLTRRDFPIGPLRSHVDDMMGERDLIFSRDCAEYEVSTPSGARILVMLNHFESKGYGSQQSSNARRRNQAQRVKEIYDERLGMGIKNIAVLGDFNDTPDSDPLCPLIQGTDLKDIFCIRHSTTEAIPAPTAIARPKTKSISFCCRRRCSKRSRRRRVSKGPVARRARETRGGLSRTRTQGRRRFRSRGDLGGHNHLARNSRDQRTPGRIGPAAHADINASGVPTHWRSGLGTPRA